MATKPGRVVTEKGASFYKATVLLLRGLVSGFDFSDTICRFRMQMPKTSPTSCPFLIHNEINATLLKPKGHNYFNLLIQTSTNLLLIASPQGSFIAPHAWEIVGRKNLTIFKVCLYSLFHIMISSSFWKMETGNLISDRGILIFLVLGTRSLAAH